MVVLSILVAVVVFVGNELKVSSGDEVVKTVLGSKDFGGKWVKRFFFSPGIQMFPNLGTCSAKCSVFRRISAKP